MIYYLVQGEAYQYPDRIAEMADSGAEVIFLTWDKQIDGALFLPNSTWSQGRNFLLQHVLKNNYKFEYLVFMDGDAKPIKGSWHDFNNFLLKKKPQICVPLMPKSSGLLHDIIKRLSISFFIPRYQRALVIDEQVQAFRKDVIISIGKYIYTTAFDQISWFYNCEVSQRILRYIAPYNIIQFNKLSIENNSHIQYTNNFHPKQIANYIKKIDLNTFLPLFQFYHTKSINIGRFIKLLNSFIELFYLIPFPIKEFDVAKRAKYVKQCLQKMKTIDIPKSKKAEDCINT